MVAFSVGSCQMNLLPFHYRVRIKVDNRNLANALIIGSDRLHQLLTLFRDKMRATPSDHFALCSLRACW
jgi:hypothetical protein